MALHIRDPRIDRPVRELASQRGIGLTEAVGVAVENELGRSSLSERIKPMQEEIRSWGATGLKADKAFFDELSGD